MRTGPRRLSAWTLNADHRTHPSGHGRAGSERGFGTRYCAQADSARRGVAAPQEVLVRVQAAAITRDELEWPEGRLPATPSWCGLRRRDAFVPERSGIAERVQPHGGHLILDHFFSSSSF